MAANVEEIVNRALNEIGSSVTIADLSTDTTKEGKVLRREWVPVVREVLRAHTWGAVKFRSNIYPVTKSAEKVANGTFTGAATSWTFDDPPWAYNANNIIKDTDGVGALSQALSITAGKVYVISFVISSLTVGSLIAELGGVPMTAVEENGTYKFSITAVSTGDLKFTPSNTSRFILDTVSVKEMQSPLFGWSFQFEKPTSPEWLRTISLSEEDVVYKMEGKYIMSNDGPSLSLVYIGLPLATNIIDVTYFDALMDAAIALRLAAAIAYPIAANLNLAKLKMGEYMAKLGEAMTVSSQEESADTIGADDWINSRQ